MIAIAAVKGAWLGAGGVIAAEVAAVWAQLWNAKSETEKKPARVSLGELVQAPDYAANLGFIHEVVDDLRHVFELIPKKDLPMIVFIDDLDRCSPGKIAAVVEAINLFLAGEFPDCMFVLGIDAEMVAAALDTAHREVIAKLPAYAKSSSIGWRFMDKFVQLPFVIPPSSTDDLARYADSLLSQNIPSPVGPAALDRAASLVEQESARSLSSEEVVNKVAVRQPLDSKQQEALKKEVTIIQDMNENIQRFSDQEEKIRSLISTTAKEYFTNPRDMKRFVNLFRFYYFLRAAREARGEAVMSVQQLCRWLVFCLKWPEVDRWLHRTYNINNQVKSSMSMVEQLAASSSELSTWQEGLDKFFGLKVNEIPWLTDESLFKFFREEASNFKSRDRLSSCFERGLC